MMIEDIISHVVRDAARDAVWDAFQDVLGEVELSADPPRAPIAVEQQAPRALSVVEAAERLGVSRSKLYELISDGDLRTLQVVRRRLVMSSEVEEFLADHAEPKRARCRFCGDPAVASYQPDQGRRVAPTRLCLRRVCLLRLVDTVAAP